MSDGTGGAVRPGAVGAHYVSGEPFDAHSIEALTPDQERYYLASQWRLMWWKLKRHRLAVVSAVMMIASPEWPSANEMASSRESPRPIAW